MSNRNLASPKGRNKGHQLKGRQAVPRALDAVRALIGAAPYPRDMLIEFLHIIQDHEGYVSSENLAALADLMKLSQADVFEVATFYAHFDVIGDDETPPAPLTIRVCDGLSCSLAGASALNASLERAMGPGVRVVRAPCVGACHKAPVAVVGQNQISHATAEDIANAAARDRTQAVVPEYQGLDAYLAVGGYTQLGLLRDGSRSAEEALLELEAANLRGLGGAGFPLAKKWRFLEGTEKPRCVVVNADEGEPGTFKDRYCLERKPHRVLEGALIAAHVTESDDIYIYLRDEYAAIRAALETEIAALEQVGLTHGISVHLRRGAGAYVCGEESALLDSMEGKRGLPRNRPPYPAQKGLFGRPTVINNVESLYWVAEILGRGGGWYTQAGRPHFYSVSGRVKEPGVKLAPAGLTLNQLIADHCQGMADGHTLAAFLPGGASGGIFPADKADVPLDFGTLEDLGGFIGSSAVIVLSDKDDIKAAARNLLHFFEDESCGQCTPCRIGCEKMSALIQGDDWDSGLLRELSQVMRDGSICGLGQAAPNPVITVLDHFAGKEGEPS